MGMELKITLKEADRLAVVKIRLRQSYQREGPKRLGKPSNPRLSKELLQKVLSLIKEKYLDYGPTLAKEKLDIELICVHSPQAKGC